MNKSLSYLLISSLVALTIVGCSGGGDSDDSETTDPVNQKPTANAGQDRTTDEQTSVALEGSGADSDGSIASYSWAQISGDSVELTGQDSQNLTFNSPVAKTELTLEFELTVTDNDGATAKDAVQVTVAPVNEEKLTLKGFATQDPIENAEVSMTVFGQEFTTTAGVDGEYEVTIEFDEDVNTDDEFFVISVNGVDEQNFVSLKSAVLSVTDLMNSAGGDGVVTSDDYLPLEISETATAMLALAKFANEDVIPANMDEFNQALTRLDGTELLYASAAIKLAISYSERVPAVKLPEGVSNTWDLVSNEADLRRYIVNSLNVAADEYDEARREVIRNLVDIQVYEELPAFYAVVTDTPSYTGNKYDFENDKHIYQSGSQAAQWSVTDGKVIGQLEGKVVGSGDTVVDGIAFTENKVLTSKEFALIQSSNTVDLVVETTTGFYRYENPMYPDYVEDKPFEEAKFITVAKKAEEFVASEVSSTMLLPLSAEMLEENGTYTTSYGEHSYSISRLAGSFTLNENGTVTDTYAVLGDGSWSVNGSGNLILTFASAVITVEKYRDDFVGVHIQDSAGEDLGFFSGYTAQRGGETLWTTENVAGVYDLDGAITTAEYSFWLDLEADGTGIQMSSGAGDANNNGIAESSEFRKTPVVWHLEGSKLMIDRLRREDGSACEVVASDCYVFNRRELDLFGIEGDRIYTTNNHKWNYNVLFEGELSAELRELWTLETIYSRYFRKQEERPFEVNF